MPVTIFCCYAREDEELLKKLKAHLRPLQMQELVDVWYDRDITWAAWEEDKQHLNAAQIVLLLISPDFMDSDYRYGIEMKRVLERHERGEAIVIPVILRPAYWQGKPLGKLQALPTGGKPVTNPDWHSLDQALHDVTSGIYKVVEQLMAGQTVGKLALPHTLTGHAWAVHSVAISSDGKWLVSGGSDKTIKVWELPTDKEVCTLTGHTGSVRSVAISGDGKTLVSGSRDGTIKAWNLSTGEEMITFTDHTS